MGKTLCIGDLSGFKRSDLVDHIVAEYDADKKDLAGCDFVVAYESVGSWGCDSESFFIFRKGGKIFEVNGSHCSCYGFEGQWTPEEVTVETLKFRVGNGSLFRCGGYDDDCRSSLAEAKAKVLRMRK